MGDNYVSMTNGGGGAVADGEAPASPSGTRCVACSAARPVNGKILSCLHVVCLTCMQDSLTSGGSYRCAECKEATHPPSGVELAKLLVNSDEYLYSDEGAGHDDAPVPAPRRSCAFCDDDGAEVTHRCAQCPNSLLCRRHADKHTTKRMYKDHTVTPLPTSVAEEPEHMCTVHHSKQLIEYCVKCQCLVCEKCATSGHSMHETSSIGAAAAKQRQHLRENLPSPSLSAYHSLGRGAHSMGRGAHLTGVVLPLQSLIDTENGEVVFVEAQTQSAVQTILEKFTDLEAIVVAHKKKLLGQMDQMRRDLESPHVERRRRLEGAVAQNQNAIALTHSFASPESSDVDLLKMAPHINSRLQQMNETVLQESKPIQRKEIVVRAEAKQLEEIRAGVDHYVRVSSHNERAASRSSNADAMSMISSTSSQLSDSVELVSGQLLDPNNASHGIIVSSDGRKAARAKGTGFGNVLGNQAYKHGIYQWHFKVAGCNDIDVGVTSLPLQYGLNGHASDSTSFVWNGSQKSRGLSGEQTSGAAKMCKWKKNDEMTMMLDCDRQTLEMYHHRTGEWRTLTDVKNAKGKGLYLYVYLWGTGNCIEFLQ